MPYIVKAGKRVIYGDSGGVHHRFAAGEIVEGAERGELEHCNAVEWITDNHAAALAETDLHRKSNKELRKMCAEAGLEATPRMNKDELIALLEGDDKPAGDTNDGESQGQGGGE